MNTRPGTGRWIVTVLLLGTALTHAVLLTRLWPDDPALAVVAGVITLAALVMAPLVLRRGAPSTLLAASVLGAVGVATYVLPGVVAALRGGSFAGLLDPWAFAGLLLDALIVRVAVLTLRRSTSQPAGQQQAGWPRPNSGQ